MAYVTGSAGNINDLLTALQNACTANGWMLTAGVLASGGCHLKAAVSGVMLTLQAGTGDDGAGNLTTPSAVTYLTAPLSAEPINYPCTYFAHVTTAEVYFVVRFSVDAYLTVGFGQSPVPGLPGTGVWLSGYAANSVGGLYMNTWYAEHYFDTYYGFGPLFTSRVGYNGGINPAQVHHGLDGGSWSQSAFGGSGTGGNGNGIDAGANATVGAFRLVDLAQPNAWNGECILAPIQPVTSRGSGFVSIIADLANARHVRLDNIAAESIIQLGADKWRVYPCYRRRTSDRNAANLSNATGTYGFAIRYDGP